MNNNYRQLYKLAATVLDYNPIEGTFKFKGTDMEILPIQTKEQGSNCTILNVLRPRLHFQASTLAWYCYYKELPVADVIYIDRNPFNNRIENLTIVPRSKRTQRNRMRSDNTSGVKGVGWNKRKKCWRVQIRLNNRSFAFNSLHNLPTAAKVRFMAEKVTGYYVGIFESSAEEYIRKHDGDSEITRLQNIAKTIPFDKGENWIQRIKEALR